jgi:toxin-antitoxin system PIN domain toxin
VSEHERPGVADARPPASRASVTWLLDVNVLLALLDPVHSHHAAAHAWYADTCTSWASCNITQNGAVRIMAHPRYGNPVASAAVAVELVAELCRQPAHTYWPADLSLLDSSLIAREHLLSAGQVTDTYLLALAVQHGGRLATFDRRLVTRGVHGGAAACEVIC